MSRHHPVLLFSQIHLVLYLPRVRNDQYGPKEYTHAMKRRSHDYALVLSNIVNIHCQIDGSSDSFYIISKVF